MTKQITKDKLIELGLSNYTKRKSNKKDNSYCFDCDDCMYCLCSNNDFRTSVLTLERRKTIEDTSTYLTEIHSFMFNLGIPENDIVFCSCMTYLLIEVLFLLYSETNNCHRIIYNNIRNIHAISDYSLHYY